MGTVLGCSLGTAGVGRLMPGVSLQVPRGRRDGLPAHVASLAQRVYWALLSQRRDQSIVALGRSGAGKTTCCEQVLEHLVGMAGSVDGSVSGTVVSRCHVAGLWGGRGRAGEGAGLPLLTAAHFAFTWHVCRPRAGCWAGPSLSTGCLRMS